MVLLLTGLEMDERLLNPATGEPYITLLTGKGGLKHLEDQLRNQLVNITTLGLRFPIDGRHTLAVTRGDFTLIRTSDFTTGTETEIFSRWKSGRVAFDTDMPRAPRETTEEAVMENGRTLAYFISMTLSVDLGSALLDCFEAIFRLAVEDETIGIEDIHELCDEYLRELRNHVVDVLDRFKGSYSWTSVQRVCRIQQKPRGGLSPTTLSPLCQEVALSSCRLPAPSTSAVRLGP